MRRAGFTFLELMVALLLLSLVFLLLSGGLQFGTRALQGRAKSDSASVVQGMLRPVFGAALPVKTESQPNNPEHVIFAGDAQSLRFVASLPRRFGVGGMYEIGLYLVPGSSAASRMEMSWRLFRQGKAASGPPAQRETLIENVDDLQFAYYGSRRTTEAPQWYDQWTDLQSLPTLIRMRIRSSDEAWPELVAATNVKSTMLVVMPSY